MGLCGRQEEQSSSQIVTRLLNAQHKPCPIKIVKMLTDNGKDLIDRLFTSHKRESSGRDMFDQLCDTLDIRHLLQSREGLKTTSWWIG